MFLELDGSHVSARGEPLEMIQLQDISIRFPCRDEALLDSVSLSLVPGTVTGLTGSSGSGKTILGLIAAGIIPDLISADMTGSVAWDSEDAARRRAAIVFQDPSFQLFSRTVREELLFGPSRLGKSTDALKKDIDVVVDGLGLENLLDNTPRELSMGECQRVAIAAALLQYPRLLVLDEPTQYMDPFNLDRTMAFTVKWCRENDVSVLLIEHSLHCLTNHADTILSLENGQLTSFDRAKRSFPRITLPAEMPHTPHIELSNVGYGYGRGKPVLSDIDLTLPKGEITAILGPNGSGKTTLGKILCGLYTPDTGKITHHDSQVKPTVSWYRNAGYVMQNPDRQLFAPTVAEECSYGPRNFAVPESTYGPFITDSLAAFHMDGYEKRDPFTLSYGEKRRVNIIGIMAYDPHVLILDEPTCALDAANQAILLSQIEHINLAGKTVVIITHDIDFARASCTRALFLREGRIVADKSMNKVTGEDIVSLYTTE